LGTGLRLERPSPPFVYAQKYLEIFTMSSKIGTNHAWFGSVDASDT
jgi:hypothetical protein